MAGIKMDVKPEVLNYYIKQSELDTEDLKADKRLKNIELWLMGTKHPTFNQLDTLSKKLRVPVGYLILDEPIDDEPPLMKYRTVDSFETEKTSRELIDTIKIIENQQEFVSDYRKKHGFDPLKYVGYFQVNESVEDFVEFSRELLGIEEDWQTFLKGKEPFKYFREKLSEIGVLVLVNGIVGQNTHRPLDINEFRAFVIIDQFAPAVFINTNDSKNGQLFSLLHEFAHILLGEQELYNAGIKIENQTTEVEKKCNQFAAEILIPNNQFINKWDQFKNIDDEEKIAEVAAYFKVSEIVAARKAFDNYYISKKEYNEIAQATFELYESNKRKEKKGGDYWNNLKFKMDSEMYSTVKNSVYEGDIQYTEALRLLGISRRAFDYLDNNIGKDERGN